jgi:endonuclease YncB( thermonuclease family)
VLRVVDGDSLVLDVRGGQFQVELAAIDAPELNQPWGGTAARRLHALLTGAFVVVEGDHQGGGRPVIGRVRFRDRDVALDLVYDGLAWSTVGAAADDEHPYLQAEAQARAARRGLWSDERPIPPWEWRSGAGNR